MDGKVKRRKFDRKNDVYDLINEEMIFYTYKIEMSQCFLSDLAEKRLPF